MSGQIPAWNGQDSSFNNLEEDAALFVRLSSPTGRCFSGSVPGNAAFAGKFPGVLEIRRSNEGGTMFIEPEKGFFLGLPAPQAFPVLLVGKEAVPDIGNSSRPYDKFYFLLE